MTYLSWVTYANKKATNLFKTFFNHILTFHLVYYSTGERAWRSKSRSCSWSSNCQWRGAARCRSERRHMLAATWGRETSTRPWRGRVSVSNSLSREDPWRPARRQSGRGSVGSDRMPTESLWCGKGFYYFKYFF